MIWLLTHALPSVSRHQVVSLHSVFLCIAGPAYIVLTGEEGGGGGREAKSYDRVKALSSIKSFNTLWLAPLSPQSIPMRKIGSPSPCNLTISANENNEDNDKKDYVIDCLSITPQDGEYPLSPFLFLLSFAPISFSFLLFIPEPVFINVYGA